jgi:hypothetical protein
MTNFKLTGPRCAPPKISSPSVSAGEGGEGSIVMPLLSIIGCVALAVWTYHYFETKKPHPND